MIPIEIINKILIYVAELNDDMIVTQYHQITNKVYYKINFSSGLLFNIKSNLIMKQIYPMYLFNYKNKSNIELYKCGIAHYKKQLLLKKNL
jgi:hypothetical protein